MGPLQKALAEALVKNNFSLNKISIKQAITIIILPVFSFTLKVVFIISLAKWRQTIICTNKANIHSSDNKLSTRSIKLPTSNFFKRLNSGYWYNKAKSVPKTAIVKNLSGWSEDGTRS